jgi:alpha-tubulin suppressor-like RCC1 family protein
MLNTGDVKCWGDNTQGALGLGDTNARGDGPNEMGANLPKVDLGSGLTATALAAGNLFNCAILNTNQVKCWGSNNFGQLGLGDTLDRGDNPNEMGSNLAPVNLGTGLTPTAITAGNITPACGSAPGR